MLWLTIAAALLAGTAAPVGGGISGPAAGTPVAALYSSAAAAKGANEVSVLSANAAPESHSATLDARIDAWIASLASEPGFISWSEATWRKYPLGPGQHGWVVIVSDKEGANELGYLVVLATANGSFQLGEYGLGDAPLFSYQTLTRALSSEEVAFTEAAAIERRYAGPMHAVWKVSEGGVTRYADAKTGVWLPVEDGDVETAESMTPFPISGEMEHPRKRLHIMKEKIVDPYMSIAWLDTAAVGGVQDWTTFVDWLNDREGEAVYAAAAFGGKVLTPIGVAGYHWWPAAGSAVDPTGNDANANHPIRGFVALDHEGLRYVPLERLLAEGSFH